MAVSSSSLTDFARILADLVDPPAWTPADRPPLLAHQVPPSGEWDLWLLEGGRGAGKSEACARYFCAWMRSHPGHRGRIIAPTFADAVASCVEGPAGVLAIDPEIRWLPSAPGGSKLAWPNGAEALVLGTPTPRDVDRLRAGGNRHLDLWEEMAANPQLADAWVQASMGLRLGEHPHSIASTTPRSRPPYRAIREGKRPDGGGESVHRVVRTHATIDENPYLNPDWRARQKATYAGTRLGRQELDGELIEDAEGALTKREWWELSARAALDPGQVHATTVGIDPGEPGPQASQALCVISRTADRDLWIVRAERSGAGPTEFLRHAVRLAHAAGATLVVERNWMGAAGEELLESVMRAMGVRVPYQQVHVTVAKRVRAEPLAHLVELGRVHALPGTEELIDEFCAWDQTGASPHLIDSATIAANVHLGGGYSGVEDSVVPWDQGGAVVPWAVG